MKKSFIFFPFLVFMTLFMFTGCNKEVAVIDSVQGNIGCNFFNPIMETDTGFYYNDTIFGKMSLHYYDKETETTIYLCAKPECAHDGNVFCPATSNSFYCSYTAIYDGYVYIAGYENDTYSLFRASPDGTELTRLVDFMKISTGYVTITGIRGGMIIHRGKAFIPYYTYDVNDREADAVNGIMMIDLNSMKCTIVDEVKYLPNYLLASGDYLYYAIVEDNYNYIFKRFDMTDNSTEELPINAVLKNFSVIEDEIWYSNKNAAFDPDTKIMIYNTVSGETREFGGNLVDEDKIEIKEMFDENGELFAYYSLNDGIFENSEIMYDGKYIFVTNDCKFKTTGFGYPDIAKEIYIFTPDGERLARFSYDYTGYYQMSVLNGKVYFQTVEGISSCLTENIINGKTEWKKELDFKDLSLNQLYEIG